MTASGFNLLRNFCVILNPPSHFVLLEVNSYRLVAYWGQNGGSSEKELNYYCTNSAYDTVVIGFVDRFEHPENKGKGNMHIKKYPIKKYKIPSSLPCNRRGM